MRIETKILTNLIYNEDYTRKVAPFIEPKYFEDKLERVIADEALKFFGQYNKLPSQDIIKIELGKRKDISDKELSEAIKITDEFNNDVINFDWLVNNTEKFCRDRAVYNAILESISIIDGKNSRLSQDAIPQILQDALAINFDQNIGHDYILDALERFEFYHRKEDKIPFDIDLLNRITAGGLTRKSLNCILAMTGGGKSLFMCHVAASTLMQSRNVLYITMEMSEERIAERIDANLMNVSMAELKVIDKQVFENRLQKINNKTQGRLIIKEYPTASAHSGHFRALLEELKIKQNFIPDLIIVDYLNICSSARIRMSASVNSYTLIKSIAEELRALSVEYNVPVLTATQSNRCLSLDTIVEKKSGQKIQIKDIEIGDMILSHSGYVEVKHVYPIEKQDVYEIATKSGKKIICSAKHIFPTASGEKNILSGLAVGDHLFVK